MYASTTTAETHKLTLNGQLSSVSNSLARAYMEMPDWKIVITAKEMALNPRVFSSKRSFRYSGTERAFDP